MRYLIFDIETESYTCRKRFSDPFEPTNKIVMMQGKVEGKEPFLLHNKGKFLNRTGNLFLNNVDVLVGQNIRFDLLYIWGDQQLHLFLDRGGLIWDTKVIDYLINGQNKSIRYDLDSLADRYGAEKKSTEVKDLQKKGSTTLQIMDKIGEDKFINYALGDVKNTEIIFLEQLKIVKARELTQIVTTYMQHYVAMLNIESNGIYFNKELLSTKFTNKEIEVNLIMEKINNYVKRYWDIGLEFNFKSPEHMSALIFGGKIIIEEKKAMVDDNGNQLYFKSGKKIGQPRYRIHEIEFRTKGIGLDPGLSRAAKKQGFYSTDESVLSKIDHPLCKLIVEFREQDKLFVTYYKGFLDCINPNTGCIHSEFNLAGTSTGRVSSSNPNVQNLHPDLLDCITSRFIGGKIIEFDWKQLEIVLVALLSRDINLLNVLYNDIDMHLIGAMRLFNKPKEEITPELRKIAKFFNFGITYGEGAKGMSERHSIDIELSKEFIQQFYDSYPMVKQWHDRLQQEAEMNKYTVGEEIHSFIGGINNKRYHLKKYPAKFDWQIKKGITHSFLPPKIKNYPVQGMASDVVSFFVGEAYKYLQYTRNDIIMIDEVHDSLILDCSLKGIRHIEKSNFLEKVVKKVNEEFNTYYKNKPLLILEHKVGNTWAECKEK